VVTTADSDNVLILEPEQARVLGQRD
jgi:hypothetical protein